MGGPLRRTLGRMPGVAYAVVNLAARDPAGGRFLYENRLVGGMWTTSIPSIACPDSVSRGLS